MKPIMMADQIAVMPGVGVNSVLHLGHHPPRQRPQVVLTRLAVFVACLLRQDFCRHSQLGYRLLPPRPVYLEFASRLVKVSLCEEAVWLHSEIYGRLVRHADGDLRDYYL